MVQAGLSRHGNALGAFLRSVLVNAVIETVLTASRPWTSAGLSTDLRSLPRGKWRGAEARSRVAALCPGRMAGGHPTDYWRGWMPNQLANLGVMKSYKIKPSLEHLPPFILSRARGHEWQNSSPMLTVGINYAFSHEHLINATIKYENQICS